MSDLWIAQPATVCAAAGVFLALWAFGRFVLRLHLPRPARPPLTPAQERELDATMAALVLLALYLLVLVVSGFVVLAAFAMNVARVVAE